VPSHMKFLLPVPACRVMPSETRRILCGSRSSAVDREADSVRHADSAAPNLVCPRQGSREDFLRLARSFSAPISMSARNPRERGAGKINLQAAEFEPRSPVGCFRSTRCTFDTSTHPSSADASHRGRMSRRKLIPACSIHV